MLLRASSSCLLLPRAVSSVGIYVVASSNLTRWNSSSSLQRTNRHVRSLHLASSLHADTPASAVPSSATVIATPAAQASSSTSASSSSSSSFSSSSPAPTSAATPRPPKQKKAVVDISGSRVPPSERVDLPGFSYNARGFLHPNGRVKNPRVPDGFYFDNNTLFRITPDHPAPANAPEFAIPTTTRVQIKPSVKQLKEAPKLSLNTEPPLARAETAIPKQKVQMYTKILRLVRSAVKGDVKNTSGDDYILDSDERKPAAQFTGLITANLSGSGRNDKKKRSGKDTGRAYGKGGRKSSKAHVWIQKAIKKGTGDFYINGHRYVEYFTELYHRWEVCAPFFYTRTLTDFDMIAVVRGGGRSGQAGAIKHAAAKALQAYDRARYRPMLKKRFLLSRDARVVERKKYGQKKARKRFTFVKR